jgi:O-acetyl-ADP-ribose deacetylase
MIKVIIADITTLKVDAIVNAANNSLLGGGGVDGAIHRNAGIELLNECRTLKGCKTGQAKITKGYNLSAKFVIHTVGPVWHGGTEMEEKLLASCYRESMNLAVIHQANSIAFPAISTGVYKFPVGLASDIAVREVQAFLKEDSSIEYVTFACFSSDVEYAINTALAKYSL